LTLGAWLLKTAINQPLHKIFSATPWNHLWWVVELQADGGELKKGVI